MSAAICPHLICKWWEICQYLPLFVLFNVRHGKVIVLSCTCFFFFFKSGTLLLRFIRTVLRHYTQDVTTLSLWSEVILKSLFCAFLVYVLEGNTSHMGFPDCARGESRHYFWMQFVPLKIHFDFHLWLAMWELWTRVNQIQCYSYSGRVNRFLCVFWTATLVPSIVLYSRGDVCNEKLHWKHKLNVLIFALNCYVWSQ